MPMQIRIAGADRVEARYKGLTIVTDQDGSAPAPFDLFLASIGTCAALYVARFCQQRRIPTEGIGLEQRIVLDPETRHVQAIELDISLPTDFPESYRDAVLRAANLCTVKKHLERPPQIRSRVTVLQPLGDAE